MQVGFMMKKTLGELFILKSTKLCLSSSISYFLLTLRRPTSRLSESEPLATTQHVTTFALHTHLKTTLISCTYDSGVINSCISFFGLPTVSELIDQRKVRFLSKCRSSLICWRIYNARFAGRSNVVHCAWHVDL